MHRTFHQTLWHADLWIRFQNTAMHQKNWHTSNSLDHAWALGAHILYNGSQRLSCTLIENLSLTPTLPSLAAARSAPAAVFELLYPNILEMEIVSENMWQRNRGKDEGYQWAMSNQWWIILFWNPVSRWNPGFLQLFFETLESNICTLFVFAFRPNWSDGFAALPACLPSLFLHTCYP